MQDTSEATTSQPTRYDEKRSHAIRYPIDPERITKGSVIGPEELERIVRIKRADDFRKYQLAVLALRCQIEDIMETIGMPVVVCQRGESLHVLTDEEAASYCDDQFMRGIRKLGRSHRQQLKVDQSQLESDESRKAHERSIVKQAAILSSITQTRKKLALQTHQRSVPSLNGH